MILRIFWTWCIAFTLSFLPYLQEKAWASVCSYVPGDSMIQSQSQCDAMSGRSWNCQTNRCDYNVDQTASNNAVASCRAECVSDNSSDQGKQNSCIQDCFQNQADTESRRNICQKDNSDANAVQKCVDQSNLDSAGFLTKDFNEAALNYSMFAIHGVFIILSVLMVMVLKGTSCPMGSALMLLGGGVVVLAGEVGAYIYMVVKEKAVKKKYANLQQDTNSQDFQRQAFMALSEEQKIRADTEVARAVIQFLSAAVFYLAALKAVQEAVTSGVTGNCATSAGSSSASSSLSSATGGLGSMVSAALAVIPKAVPDSLMKILRQLLGTPITRAVLGALFGSLSVVLGTNAVLAAKTCYKRKKAIDDTLEQLSSNWSPLLCEKRNDPKVPQCYCYTSDGQQDPAKLAVSQSCQNYINRAAAKAAPAATDYTFSQANGEGAVGCVNINNDFDQNCTCQKILDAKGNNACKKSDISLNLAGVGQAQIVGNVQKLTNDILSGQGVVGSVNNPLSNAKMAARIIDEYNQKRVEAKNYLNKQGQNTDALKVNAPAKLLREFQKQLPASAMEQVGNFNKGNSSGGEFMASLSGKAKELLDQNLKKVDSDLTYQSRGNAGSGSKKESDSFSFKNLAGDNGSGGASGEGGGGVLNVPAGGEEAKQIHFKNDDISTRSSESLFELVSQRYRKSAYQHLFPSGASN